MERVSLGRKNYLFFGSDHGGERGALLYSLIGTCRLNGVEPERYLHHVHDVIADWPVNRSPGASHCQLNNTSPSIRFSLDAYKKHNHNILNCMKKLAACGQFFRDKKGVGMNFLH